MERVLDPLGLVLKGGNWYLAARCDGVERTYRVSRIDELVVTEDVFVRPDGFDLATYWQRWSEGFERRLYPDTAIVRLSGLGRELVPIYLGTVGAAALSSAGEVDESGWCTVELPVERGAPALGELLRFGPELEVLAPVELRSRVAEAAAAMTAFYGVEPR